MEERSRTSPDMHTNSRTAEQLALDERLGFTSGNIGMGYEWYGHAAANWSSGEGERSFVGSLMSSNTHKWPQLKPYQF